MMSAELPNADRASADAGVDPFVDAHGENSYFVTSTLRQRIDLIRHLIQFGRQIVVLTGPPGAGKSALIERITEAHENNWQVMRFSAGPTLNRATLLGKTASELGLSARTGDDEALTEAIRKRVQIANRRGETTVLAIDDAHTLPADTRTCLAKLAHSVDESTELKVVLSADPAQSPLIDQLQNENSQHTLVHVVELPRLNEAQTAAMLKHRWDSAYGNLDFPLERTALSQIYRQSNGIPGKAIVLARQLQRLTDHTDRTLRDPARGYLIGGVAIIALLSVFAFFNAADRRDSRKEIQIELELPAEQPVVTESSPSRPAELPTLEPQIQNVRGVDDSDSVEVVIDDDPSSVVVEYDPPIAAASLSGPAVPSQSPEPAVQPPQAETVTKATATDTRPPPAASPPVDDRSAEKSVRIPSTEPPPTPIKVLAAPASGDQIATKPAPEHYSIEWLRTQAAAGYVLQLFGVRNRAAAVKFIKTRKIQHKSTVMITSHKGAPWYVVVYGYYRNRDLALAAIPALPPALAPAKPWARPISSLQ